MKQYEYWESFGLHHVIYKIDDLKKSGWIYHGCITEFTVSNPLYKLYQYRYDHDLTTTVIVYNNEDICNIYVFTK